MQDPIGGFQRIRDLYITYLETAFRIKDVGVSRERRALLERPNTFCTEPLIEPLPRYETVDWLLHDLADNVGSDERLPGLDVGERRAFVDLVLAGLLDSESDHEHQLLGRRAVFELYKHQAKMLRHGVQKGSPGIVTSGTGSGKTESFLLPVLAMLAKEAVHWPSPSAEYLKHRWWQDSSGMPYAKYEGDGGVPNRPSSATKNTSPFRLQRTGEAKERPAAVRALILYPMNALVEDQLTRIRHALDSDAARKVMDHHFGGNRIFFGRYTGDTPVTGYHRHPRPDNKEHKRRDRKLAELFRASVAMQYAQDRAREMDKDRAQGTEETRYLFPSVDGGELTSRWDMQETPPDLLITNVSMLNAMIAREVDSPILDRTRGWLTSCDDAYFFLVLDELHLQRGSAGTETSYLLRLLFERLGLTDPAHRHKLRILASSASMPMDGEEGESSLAYLWDMFGRHGLQTIPQEEVKTLREGWRKAVVTGVVMDTTPRTTTILKTAPFLALLDRAGGATQDELTLPSPLDVEEEWRAVAHSLIGGELSTKELQEVVGACVQEAGARIAHACWSEKEGRARAVLLSHIATRVFGSKDDPGIQATRALLMVRGSGDLWEDWWSAKPLLAPSFRVHTFFRSIEGLFAPVGNLSNVPAKWKSSVRKVGELSVERGQRFTRTNNDDRGDRLVELIYCESCGELFLGGRRGGRENAIELLPAEPNIDNLPESASQDFFETLSANDYAVFWPMETWPGVLPSPRDSIHVGEWRRAYFNSVSATVHFPSAGGAIPEGRIAGYIWERGDIKDQHGRQKASSGTAVPYECPACGSDYFWRKPPLRLSPLRSFRAGFAKTTQLLATELFDLLRLRQQAPKLVAFADSRQDAARAALDIELRHHEDLRREIVVESLRSAMKNRPSNTVLTAEYDELFLEWQKSAQQGNLARAMELQARLSELKVAISDDSDPSDLPLSVVLEDSRNGSRFSGPRSTRDLLRPLLAEFVRLGVHPTDPTGTKRIKLSDNESVPWEALFTIDKDGIADWRDDAIDQDKLNRARLELVSEISTVRL